MNADKVFPNRDNERLRILMVCLGNICRSPLAEGILQSKARRRGLPWLVDSAGTGSWHVGEPPDPRSIETARRHGIDISQQRARRFSPRDFDAFDLIFVMDAANLRDVLSLADGPAHRQKVRLILEEVFPGEDRSVPDPYWNDDGFEAVFHLLDQACDKIIEKYGKVQVG